MSKKIIAVNAGPRKGWNTDTLIDEAIKGAEAAGGQRYEDALDSLPEELKAVDIGYNDVIESAFR